MSKLVDIKGDWEMSIGYSFNNNGMWEGKLILEDDGWFEGIVNDLTSPYTGDRMIFGIYHPNKIIELFKVSPANVSDPFVFRGQRTAIGYEGYFSVLGDYEEKYCGSSNLITQHVNSLKEMNYVEVADRDTESEKKELAKRIAVFKQNDDFEELYKNIVAIRTYLTEYVLRKYNGETFTKEQIIEFLNPVSRNVEEDMGNTGKSLVRKLLNNFDSDDDDDELPFK